MSHSMGAKEKSKFISRMARARSLDNNKLLRDASAFCWFLLLFSVGQRTLFLPKIISARNDDAILSLLKTPKAKRSSSFSSIQSFE